VARGENDVSSGATSGRGAAQCGTTRERERVRFPMMRGREMEPLTTGIVAFDRFATLEKCRKELDARVPGDELLNDHIAGAYRGVDGKPWPCPLFDGWDECGTLPLSDLGDIRMLAASSSRPIDVVLLAHSHEVAAMQHAGWKLLGYDLGYFHAVWSVFSVLFHEVIYGLVPELGAYAKFLNRSLLLDTPEAAAKLLATRETVDKAGGDIEGDEMSIIAVLERT